MLPIVKKIREILSDNKKTSSQKNSSIAKELKEGYVIKPEEDEYITGNIDKEIDNNICLTQTK